MKKPTIVDRFAKGADVSLERVEKFGILTRGDQLAILTTLRSRGIEDNAELGLFGLLVPLAVSMSIALAPVEPLQGPVWAKAAALLIVGILVALLLMAIVGIPLLLRHQRRVSALVLLAAYEDELTRWRTLSGRQGRKWRAAH